MNPIKNLKKNVRYRINRKFPNSLYIQYIVRAIVDPSATRRFTWVRKTTRKQAGIGAKLSGIEYGGGKRQRGRNMPASQAIPEIRSASNCREHGTRNHTCHRRHDEIPINPRAYLALPGPASREFELANCSPNILPSFRRCFPSLNREEIKSRGNIAKFSFVVNARLWKK